MKLLDVISVGFDVTDQLLMTQSGEKYYTIFSLNLV